jgi:hypothetical protein
MKIEARNLIEEVVESAFRHDRTIGQFVCPAGEAHITFGREGGHVVAKTPTANWTCKGSDLDLLAEFAVRALRPDLFNWEKGWPKNFRALSGDPVNPVFEIPESEKMTAEVKATAAPSVKCQTHEISYEEGKHCAFCRSDERRGVKRDPKPEQPQQSAAWWTNNK